MQAGKLRHRVELQRKAHTKDGYGEVARNFATFATRYAEIRYMSGSELENAQQVVAEATHKVRIRYDSEVTVNTRLKFNGRIFEVLSVQNPTEINEELILLCKESQE